MIKDVRMFVWLAYASFFLVAGNSVFANPNKLINSYMKNETECPFWFYYDTSQNSCQCLESWDDIWCDGEQAYIDTSHFLTYDRYSSNKIVSVSNSSNHQFLNNETKRKLLPKNISDLNEVMCGPLNRKSYLCSDCIDGFGPSIGLMDSMPMCYNCTGSLYGVSLYILVEFTPITLFYIFILVLQFRLTSAPMTCWIMYSQCLMMVINLELYTDPLLQKLLLTSYGDFTALTKLMFVLYGIFNLEFIRYVVPPFCISNHLRFIHVTILGYISIAYPILLIMLTWLSIELYDRNVKLVVCLWKPFHRCLTQLRKSCNTKIDLINVFATFLLLSYTKLVTQLILMENVELILNYSLTDGNSSFMYGLNGDNSIRLGSLHYLINAITAGVIFILFNVLPTILLVLYPVNIFRRILSKCKLDRASLMIFMEKFHSCYKDGLDGGRDMRSFSAFYFLLRSVLVIGVVLIYDFSRLNRWLLRGMFLSAAAILIALCRPYKKMYMTICDTLLLAHMAFICYILSSNLDRVTYFVQYIQAMIVLPHVVFALAIFMKLMCKLFRFCFKTPNQECDVNNSANSVERQRLIQPVNYYGT